MQIKNDLTYKVTREGRTEPPFQESTIIIKKKEYTSVFIVELYYFHLRKSMNLVQVGHPFMM